MIRPDKDWGAMTRRIATWAARAAVIATGFSVGAPGVVSAQGGDGFLFKQPRVSIKFETGYGFQRANSDIFDFLMQEHTLGTRDFDSPYLGGEFAVRVAERWDVALSAGWQRSSADSEFRDWVDSDDLPIVQVTELQLVPVTVSAKYYLLDRGRRISRFAWIPRPFAPFVGAGTGFVSYRLEQHGDFVDYETLDIFSDKIFSQRSAFLARVLAGVNVSLSKQFLFTAEARYAWASGDLGAAYSDFNDIDLTGVQLVGGIGIRF
jgi:hypothetical protein